MKGKDNLKITVYWVDSKSQLIGPNLEFPPIVQTIGGDLDSGP